ncbi:similar to Saccharomyces cerevisiae YML088W UFO1 F-box receptor protein, subunit of the Skp1-Cdc53-F-box receptor (SCF) E3 ubiquitin ligase complex [Maudiozyma saulgeensis]|uniref:Similar to Saccharomyces cerevisiae YML088W UFO1 F-box receptor protein, subunit of the Skp1-Cdc53-F-box receptor (SCF) E3 ubiquitin ligase complex n=1 Tax=Maudiozyma saulgeensis TaxID=1789683 RepID=A0A1X7R8M8_9SACH|nr:similar to Saccharomyces cerevisiae YML088W UFO1 F-box receptor protein, subunit of the Skp1-Cdc53-F-box receptor (SCF) E3 ubiquitin ligase complex [Kazachstania saulgeensis]
MISNTTNQTLETLPTEILFNIFSYLDEPDLCHLQQISKIFNTLITADELWKYLIVARLGTTKFPSLSRSFEFHKEYVTRRDSLLHWRHNRVVRTKYAVSPFRSGPPNQFLQQQQQQQQQGMPIESLVFSYPRCACYNDGTITLIHLQNKRSRQRLTYIPCTTPQGCSTLDFSINAAVFGRFDGRVFGKLLGNKSYLTPATEFNSTHSTCVTAIASLMNDTSAKEHRCVSASENGELIWWEDTKRVAFMKPTIGLIWKLYYWKDFTLALDHKRIYIIQNQSIVHSLPLPLNIIRSSGNNTTTTGDLLQFVNVDFGSRTLIMASNSTLYTICFDPNNAFGTTQTIQIKDIFPNISTTITNVYMDESTAINEQDFSLAGNDGCYIALLTSDNDIAIINIRNIASTIKIQTTISFDEQIHSVKVTNLLIIVAIANQIHLLDSSTGSPIKVIQKTDKYPQFLDISENKILIGSGNVLHLLEFITSKNRNSDYDNDSSGMKNSSSSHKNRSNKWIETLNTQMNNFDEEETYRYDQRLENNRLLETYGGDITPTSRNNEHLLTVANSDNDEDVQLRIALLESQSVSTQENTNVQDEEEQLRRAIEESQRILEQETDHSPPNTTLDDLAEGDDEFRRALELSMAEEEQRNNRGNITPNLAHPLSDDVPRNAESSITNTNNSNALSEDEELQLALALSLSEIN